MEDGRGMRDENYPLYAILAFDIRHSLLDIRYSNPVIPPIRYPLSERRIFTAGSAEPAEKSGDILYTKYEMRVFVTEATEILETKDYIPNTSDQIPCTLSAIR